MTGAVNNNVITAGTNENIQTSEPVRNTNAREEFDILDEEALPPQNTLLSQNMLRNVRFHRCTGLNNEQIAVIDNMRAPKVRGFFSNLFSKIGRSVVGFVHAFKSRETRTILNDTLRTRTNALRNIKADKLPELPRDSTPVSMDAGQIGKLTGLGSRTRVIPFVPYENEENRNASPLQKMLFPHGEPRFDDIKQNPRLQDCWFLSSISSILNSQGAEGIERLFSPSAKENHVLVRLGKNQYEVPLGRYTNGSENFGSRSANWVVALENAMQMHLLAMRKDEYSLSEVISNPDSNVNIRMRGAEVGLKALLCDGYDVTLVQNPESETGLNTIKTAIKNNRPVVLGHAGGLFKALSDGISPKHAVSVLGMSPDEKSLIVQDPYGKTKMLAVSKLHECSVCLV